MAPKVVIGLTGSIGMGKSTTAAMFAEAGVPVWDADKAVHRLYTQDKAAISAIGRLCPDAIVSGVVDRSVLKRWISENGDGLAKLEAVVHPLIAANREEFIETNPAETIVLDIPLLFEGGLDREVDYIVVVTAPEDVQRARVMERGTMSEAQFESILAKQLPDEQKRARADFVIETTSLEAARADVQTVLETVRKAN